MKKKSCKKMALFLALLAAVGSFTACGAMKSAEYAAAVIPEAADYGVNEKSAELGSMAAVTADGGSAASGELAMAASRKLVKNGEFRVQTNDFDTFTAKLEEQITALGGYVESSSISGNSYGYEDCRSAEFTVRIPAQKFDALTKTLSAVGTVVSQNETVQDVTDDYIDVESHIAALKAEQEALLAILKKAETVSEIIEVQTRLTEVRAESESYQSRLNVYDNMIAYSTVTVYAEEVERVSPAEKEGFWGEVGSRLRDNLYDLGQGFRDFAVWFISSLPNILLFAAVALAVILPVRHKIKRKRAARKAKFSTPPEPKAGEAEKP